MAKSPTPCLATLGWSVAKQLASHLKISTDTTTKHYALRADIFKQEINHDICSTLENDFSASFYITQDFFA